MKKKESQIEGQSNPSEDHSIVERWFPSILKNLALHLTIAPLLALRKTNRSFRDAVDALFNVFVQHWHLKGFAGRFDLSQRQIAAFHVAMRDKLMTLQSTEHQDAELNLKRDFGFAFFIMQDLVVNDVSRLDELPPWYLHSCELKNVSLNNCFLSRSTLLNCRLDKVAYTGVVMSQAVVKGCLITENNWHHFDAQGSQWQDSLLEKVVTANMDLSEASFSSMQFSACDFDLATFNRCTFLDCQFEKVRFIQAKFNAACTFDQVTFVDCNFTGSQIELCQLSGVKFSNCTMSNGRTRDAYGIPTNTGLTKSLRRPRAFLNKELPQTLQKMAQSTAQKPMSLVQNPNTTSSDASHTRFFSISGSERAPAHVPLPELSKLPILEEYQNWLDLKLGHWKVLIGPSTPERTALCRIAYAQTRDDSADILYFLWLHKLPILSQLCEMASPEADRLREKLLLDIHTLLALIHPLLLYFAYDIVSHFQYEDDEKPAPSRRDFTPNLLGLAIVKEHDITKSLLNAQSLANRPEFADAFSHEALRIGQQLVNQSLTHKIEACSAQIMSLQEILPEALFFDLIIAADDYLLNVQRGIERRSPEQFIRQLLTQETRPYLHLAEEFMQAKIAIEKHERAMLSDEIIEKILVMVHEGGIEKELGTGLRF